MASASKISIKIIEKIYTGRDRAKTCNLVMSSLKICESTSTT